ncbi:MAG: hypothetical protein CVU48_09035 [Candidatus Cloacimonetes bacterium HGW-Cloacimonetes-1]|jgi:RNA polymerase sigma factor (sigma-70 family)|nr:MAG: hypothetical protein CVU48_09035 [Candidatus Cloacimonetes bacterium HGW-Cloacimonetes-1]
MPDHTDNSPITFPANGDQLIRDYRNLAYSIAYTYRYHHVPLEDLQQESLIGLWEAYTHFDLSRNVKFSTYAVYWIKKYVLAAISKEHGQSLNAMELNEDVLKAIEQPAMDTVMSSQEELDLPHCIPQTERQILNLCYQNRYTIKEIAAQLSLTNEKVKQLRAKALRRIKVLQIRKMD